VRLASGRLELVLAPEVGGSIARFDYVGEEARVPILRGAEGVPGRVLDAASFPLVPYSNRIRGGRFAFRGRELSIAPNMAGDSSPLHGQGWLSAWEAQQLGGGEAELRFRHEGGEWPWAYEARQHLSLSETALTIRLSCRNLSREGMPCGLGQHPYFPCTADTRLDTQVAAAWEIDENVLPVARVPAEGRFDLTDRGVCGQDLDHGFDGWSGSARITDPALPFAIELSSPDAICFQLYSPAGGGLFVAEPVTHTNAALNEPEEEWLRLGLRVLEPGEEMEMTAAIRLLV
jgi:aldose 1-epimerase